MEEKKKPNQKTIGKLLASDALPPSTQINHDEHIARFLFWYFCQIPSENNNNNLSFCFI